MNKKPIYLILKIVGFIGIAVAVFGGYLSITSFGNFENNNFMIGSILATFGLFVGVSCLVSGFRTEIMKHSIKTAKIIQEENKEVLTEIANNVAEISSGAVEKTAQAVKKGVSEEKAYCKHCGALIDADSKFCSKCGKEL